MNTRNEYFDFLRGLAIMMVVAIHTYNQNTDSIVIRQLLNSAVPIFIAISGYFLSQKVMDARGEYIRFLRKQLPKVYYQCYVVLPLVKKLVYRTKWGG